MRLVIFLRMKNALKLIADERARQIFVKGWTPEHDDTHTNQEIPKMAAVYAMPCSCRTPQTLTLLPWDVTVPDPRTEAERLRELVKAGALIVAEIERLQRLRVDNATINQTGPSAP